MRVLSLVTAAVPLLLAGAQAKKPVCPAKGVHMIVGSGAGGAMVRGYGLLNTTMQAVKHAIPGSSNYSIPFTKTNVPSAIPSAVANGADLLANYTNWYAKGCPDTPLAIIGYSEGGMVSMDSVCGSTYDNQTLANVIDPAYYDQIIGIVLYGEETRVPNQTYNAGTCIDGEGDFEREEIESCYDWAASKMISYCDLNDPYCCNGSPAPDSSVHYVYPAEYNNDTAAFFKSQYQAWKASR